MSFPIIETAFVVGEVAPALFGHTDLARLRSGAATMRNLWPNYHGGAYSRAGTKFVGFSKQTGRQYRPRLVPFQFSIKQGLVLEFGNFYMRVISDGAFVSDALANITAVSQTSPAVIGFNGIGAGAASAVPIDAGVTQSYAPGDQVTLAGGSPTTPTVLAVASTQLVNLSVSNPGSGVYAPGDTINLAGGVQTTTAVLTVLTTKVIGANIVSAGSGGPAFGTGVVAGTTGTGLRFQAAVRFNGSGGIASIVSIGQPGDYTVNPANPAAEPVAAGALAGAVLDLAMGVNAVAITNPGVFTVNAPGGFLTQASSSGSGVGANFVLGIFGPHAVTVATAGVYATYPPNPVAQASTTGSGSGATFTVTTTPVSIAPFNNGDWVSLSELVGPIALDGGTYVVQNVTSNSAQLFDVYGNAVDGTAFPAYVSGGLASRIYTLTTIYAEADLSYLKFTQSADVMSLCCVNQNSGVEYPPQDLSRTADDDWTFTPAIPVPSIEPPASCAVAGSTTGSVDYAYQVTAVNPVDGTESIASPIGNGNSLVDVAAAAGTITVTWSGVAGVNSYNIYKATPSYSTNAPPVGALFGYAGSAYGLQFDDSNIVADFTQVPPTHQDPFARGQIVAANVLTSGGTTTSVSFTINTTTGSGAVLVGVIGPGLTLAAILVEDAGSNYAPTDTLTITVSGGGSATGNLTIGPQSGTYPGVVAYFQQRRFYGYTLNNPDTYWASQPGAFTNFDSRIPTIDSDAITGTPWSVAVDGIQFFLPMPGGLVTFTGSTIWQVGGGSGGALSPTPITPSSQSAQAQSSVGCSATVGPIRIQSDIIYLEAKQANYLAANYQIYANNYVTDYITLTSSHLFMGFSIIDHAWCEEPYKLLWSVRSDGCLLSLTYLRPQEVIGWGRHDTNGLFVSVAAITESTTDVLYTAAQRFPNGNNAYMIERMDDRIWTSVENTWCVDCGLELPQPAPAANLTASSAAGLGAVTGVADLVGGAGYSAGTTAQVVDDNGEGSGAGAVPTLTIVGGVITAVSFAGNEGANYSFPELVFSDPANSGSGASATCVLDTTATFTADAPVFSAGNVGSVIRMGGGIAEITAYTDSQHVTAQILSPIAAVIPNSGGVVQQQPSGSWTMTAPVTQVTGLQHLIGATVTGLADGNVVPPTVVAPDGSVTLATPASAITLGLGFQAQLQSVYLDAGEPTAQGQRKKIAAATVRVEASRGLKVGSNQVDGSTLSPALIAPVWQDLADAPDKAVRPFNALATPLYTGDIRVSVSGGYATPGQVAVQQDNPLPMQILGLIPEDFPGDTPQLKVEPRRGQQQAAA